MAGGGGGERAPAALLPLSAPAPPQFSTSSRLLVPPPHQNSLSSSANLSLSRPFSSLPATPQILTSFPAGLSVGRESVVAKSLPGTAAAISPQALCIVAGGGGTGPSSRSPPLSSQEAWQEDSRAGRTAHRGGGGGDFAPTLVTIRGPELQANVLKGRPPPSFCFLSGEASSGPREHR